MKLSFQIIIFLIISNVVKAQLDTLDYPCLKLINKKIPLYKNTTIDGMAIDSNYFKGKVTLLTFFGFGCGPCFSELRILDEISKTYPKDKYHILFLGDATEKDLRDLRSYHSKSYGKTKRRLGVDTLAFDIIADCPENPVRFIARSCKGSTETFKVTSFPCTFFINQEGIIKEVCIGFSMKKNKIFDDYFYAKLKEAEK